MPVVQLDLTKIRLAALRERELGRPRGEASGPVRGEEFLNPAGRMGGDTDQYVSEIADHVDVLAAKALDQRVDDGGGAPTPEARNCPGTHTPVMRQEGPGPAMAARAVHRCSAREDELADDRRDGGVRQLSPSPNCPRFLSWKRLV